MNDLEQRVTRALHGLADDLPAPDTGLVEVTVRRARRIRRRRAVGATVAAIAVVALAVPAVGTVLERDNSSRVVNPGPTPAPRPPAKHERTADPRISELRAGAPPAVPYTLGGAHPVLVDGTTRIPLPANRFSVPYGRVGSGYLVLTHGEGFTGADDSDAELAIVTAGGGRTVLGHGGFDGVVLDRPAAHAAWGTPDKLALNTTLNFADLPSGQVVASHRFAHTFVSPLAIIGAGVVFNSTSTRPHGYLGHLGLWSPDTNAVTVLARNVAPVSVSGDGTRALVASGSDYDCTTLVALPSGDPRFERCVDPRAVSPDGKHIIAVTGSGWSSLDASTGAQKRLRFAGVSNSTVEAWEDTRHVLLVSFAGHGKQAVVRCDVETGRCERALDPVRGDIAFG